MIALASKELCSACGACMSVCPHDCITMKSNIVGQFFPYIDNEKCVTCHACEKVCPVLNEPKAELPRKAYASWSLNEEQHRTSASGGIAYELYKYAINHGYKVVGASSNEDLSVSLKIASTIEEIPSFKNSKYVFSECYNLYPEMKKALREGSKILVAGMPCQIAAMRNLFHQFDNILYVEILCHGMVPFSYLQQHVSTIEREKKEKAYTMSFRAPEAHTYTCTFALYNKDGKCFYAASKNDGDTYQIGFSRGITYLESCYHCRFAKRERAGDIILCDFWGLGKEIPFLHDEKEVSCILTVTEKGEQFMDSIFRTNALFVEERPISEAVKGNPRLRIPNSKTKNRMKFEKNIVISQGNFEKAIAPLADAYMKTLNRSIWYYHWQGLKYRLRKLFKK